MRLHLSSRPENVAVAREALAGLAETIALSREQYDDVRTAVTEACNNVVQHAYADGERRVGPLEMEILVLDDAIEVTVRDEGIGLSHMAAEGAGELEIGLPVILALADRLQLGHPPNGGTELQMRFLTPGIASLDAPAAPPQISSPASPDLGEFDRGRAGGLGHPRKNDDRCSSGRRFFEDVPTRPTGEDPKAADPGEEIVIPGFEAEVRLSFSSSGLAATILPRVAAALAVRAHFTADRVSDVQLLSDSIAAHAFEALDGERLEVGLSTDRRTLGMQVGPLLAGGADRIGLVGRLSDRQVVTPIGPAEVLVLYLDDRA